MNRLTRRTPVILCGLVLLSGCATSLSRAEIVAAQQGAPVSSGLTDATGAAAGGPDSGSATDSVPVTVVSGAANPRAIGRAATRAPGAAGTAASDPAAAGGKAKPATAGVGGEARPATAAAGHGAAPAQANHLPITVGFVGSITGLYGTSFRPVLTAIQANITDLNSGGGINGHPIKLIVADDGGDPANYLAQLRRMVEQDKVIGFVGNTHGASLSQAAVDYVGAKGIPILDGDDSNLLAPTSPMIFGFGAAGIALNGTEFAAARDLLGKGLKVGFISCQEVQQCSDYATTFGGFSAKAGFTPVFAGRASLTAPDFTANCLQARNAGAQVLFLRIDINSVKRIGRDCSRQGYKPTYVTAPVLTDPSSPSNPAMDRLIIPSQQFPFIDNSLPEEKRFRSVLLQTVGLDQIFAAHAQGWNVADIFAKAAQSIAPDATPSTALLLKGLYTFKSETLGGTSQPLTYVPGKPPAHVNNMCAFPMQVVDGKWTAPRGNKPSCL
jgi:branched-chain amino acid transport system substrate-binding protein